MQEKQVTIGEQTLRACREPFLVLATQNPIEQEGTYPLPEAQVDRFMLKVVIDYPTRGEKSWRSSTAWAPVEPHLDVRPVMSAAELATVAQGRRCDLCGRKDQGLPRRSCPGDP